MRHLYTILVIFVAALVGFVRVENGSIAAAQTTEAQSPSVSTTQSIVPSPSPSPTPAPPAVQPVNLTLSPISINLIADPGGTASAQIKIRNNAAETEYLKLRLATFTASATGDTPVIQDFEPTDAHQFWLSFPETAFEVGPGEWKTIPLYFSPPKTAALGYYYAILVERQQEAVVEQGQSLISGIPALLVLTEVNSPLAKRELELVSFTASKKMYEYLPAEFEITIRNTGNIQAMPLGDLFIDGQRTNDLAAVQINPAKGMILPNSQRTFTVAWDDGFPRYITELSPTGKKNTQLKWEFSRADKFRLGKFSATALFVYDDGSRDVPTQASLNFWVIPWKLLIILTIISILVVVGIALPSYLIIKKIRSRTNPSQHE